MRLDMPQDLLVDRTREYGATASEYSQVRKRLHRLLPDRLNELKRALRPRVSAAKAERLALTDERYLKHLDEYITILGQSLEARIQYDTHLMLIDARRSLRAFRR